LKTLAIILILISVVTLSGCASGYWLDRGRDAADVLTLGLGSGAGAKARVGPIQAGLLSEQGLAGLRGGEFLGAGHYWANSSEEPAKWDDVIFLVGRERFEGTDVSNRRGKSFKARQILFSWPFDLSKDPDYGRDAARHHIAYNPWPYMTQVEAVAGGFLTFRVGANPGELLDFVFGWTTLDICGDDVGVVMEAAPAPEPAPAS